jgi:hypothetical protein
VMYARGHVVKNSYRKLRNGLTIWLGTSGGVMRIAESFRLT